MAARTYQNFDLLVEAVEGGSFRARVTSCPAGQSPSAMFSLPFDPTQLENLMLKLDPGRSGTRRAGADQQTQACLDFGGPLFEAVFSEDIMLIWSRSQDVTRAAGEGLRLRLRLTDAPAIAGLPWELLYDRRTNSYLAQSERTPLVRYLEVPHPPRPLAVGGALRILVVISSPTDLPELDVETEWRRVHDALATKVEQGVVVIDRLPAPTMEELSSWLRSHDVHILHFIGHGDYDVATQDGVLYFCDRYGRSQAVGPSTLGPFLHDHDPLRLVLLNACRSARVGATDPFGGMAQGLVQQDVTAVVAMQFPISDGAAVTFTGEFYGAVADGIPVDQAAAYARKGLLLRYPGEWATPVLFLRAPDGRVFDQIVPTSPPAPATLRLPTPAQTPPRYAAPAPDRAPAPEPSPVGFVTGTGDPEPTRRGGGLRPLVLALLIIALVAGVGGYSWYRNTRVGAAGGERQLPPVTTLTGPKITAVHLTTGLKVDADAQDWPAALPAFDSNVLVSGAAPTVKARWVLGWDVDNLSFIVEVTDPVRTQTHADDVSQLFNGDGLSFELGTAVPKKRDASLEPGDLHVMLGPAADDPNQVIAGINVASGKSFTPGASTIQGLKASVAPTSRGYRLEAQIPWSTLGVSDPQIGTQLGTNLNVSDAIPNGARRGQLLDMVSNNRARSGNDSPFRSVWGTLTLTS